MQGSEAKKTVAKLQDLLLQARILRLAEKGIFMIHIFSFYRYGPWETRNYESSDILQEIWVGAWVMEKNEQVNVSY